MRVVWLAALLPSLHWGPGSALPAFLLFLMLGGPLNLMARRPSACSRCGDPLPRDRGRGGAGVAAPVVPITERKKGRSQAP